MSRLIALVAVATLGAACGSAATVATESPTTTATIDTTVAEAADSVPDEDVVSVGTARQLPALDTRFLADSDTRYVQLRADGDHLYAIEVNEDRDAVALVRLDPASGAHLASHALPPRVRHLRPTYRMTDDAIWAEQSETTLVQLDRLTLEPRGEIEVLAGVRRITSTVPAPSTWVSYHEPLDVLQAGSTRFNGAALLDPDTGATIEEHSFPICGALDVAETATSTWFSLSCRNQFVILDQEGGQQIVSPFPNEARLVVDGDAVWASFAGGGVVARMDAATAGIDVAYHVNLDGVGPTLERVQPGALGDSHFVAISTAIADDDPAVLTTFGRADGRLVGQAAAPGVVSVAAIGDTGYVALESGGLATFALADMPPVPDPTALEVSPTIATDGFEPSSEDERAAAAAFALATTVDADPGVAVEAIENGDRRLMDWIELRDQVNATFPGVAVDLATMFLDGDIAFVSYEITLDGNPAFAPRTAELLRIDDAWLLSEASFCDLASVALAPCDG